MINFTEPKSRWNFVEFDEDSLNLIEFHPCLVRRGDEDEVNFFCTKDRDNVSGFFFFQILCLKKKKKKYCEKLTVPKWSFQVLYNLLLTIDGNNSAVDWHSDTQETP